MAPDGAAPPSNVQETVRNLVGCASLHRTVGRLRTLPWDAEARAPPLRDSTVTGSSTPPYHTPSSELVAGTTDRKSTRLNSSHLVISYAVFCLKKKKKIKRKHLS